MSRIFCHKLLVLPLVECIYGMFCNKYVVKIVYVTYYVIKMIYGSDSNHTVYHAYFDINFSIHLHILKSILLMTSNKISTLKNLRKFMKQIMYKFSKL